MVKLSCNLNAVAYLRNRRGGDKNPDLLSIARIVMDQQVNGITVHPRPDQRHITDTDVRDLKRLIEREYFNMELNVEGYPDKRFIALVGSVKPQQVTLVPDHPTQLTSTRGWNKDDNLEHLNHCIKYLQDMAMRVSVFVSPDLEDVKTIAALKPDVIEIYTGDYALAATHVEQDKELNKVFVCARVGYKAGIEINAGHDLSLDNLSVFLKRIPFLREVSIGHAMICEALINGYENTVKKYLSLCQAK